MPWSIFTQGGGQGAALTWAEDLLRKIGAPETEGNKQFVYDWEVSEGGGGAYNPLNQGDVPGHPELTTSGSQYGGGAADYASWGDGLQGAADYLGMSSYAGIEADLQANDPEAARSALWQSGWASSHYGYGSAFSDAAIPGHASALPPDAAGSTKSGGSGFEWWNPFSWASSAAHTAASDIQSAEVSAAETLAKDLAGAMLVGVFVIAGLALVVVGAARATGHKAAPSVAPVPVPVPV